MSTAFLKRIQKGGRSAEEIVKLLQNNDLRIELGLRPRRLFERSYTFEDVAFRTLEMYAQIERTLGPKRIFAER